MNADATAIEAAADHFLTTEKAKRVDRAQTLLTQSEQRLAEAEAEHERASAQFVQHEWDGSRKSLLAAETELTLARATHAQRIKQLALAKTRWSDAQRATAIAKAKAEHEWSRMAAERDAIKAKLTSAARDVVTYMIALADHTMHFQGVAMELRAAAESFGHVVHDHSFNVPAYSVHVADSILTACRSLGYSPWSWKEADPTKLAGGVTPLAGAQAVLEPIENLIERNKTWMAGLHAEARRNDATNIEAARERAARR